MDISSYLREYARITLASIKAPRKFFEEVKSEGEDLSKPFSYLLISNIVFVAGLLGTLFLSAISRVLAVESYILVILVLLIVITLLVIFTVLFSISFIAVMHLAVILVRGNIRFYQTFKVICYAVSPLNLAWVFVIAIYLVFPELLAEILSLLGLFVGLLYTYYILVVGISVTSEISGSRAFAALVTQLFILFSIPILAYAPAFFYQYDTSTPPDYSPTPSPAPYPTPAYENYSPPNPEKYRITAYAGSPPQIDGAVTEEDKWYEGEQFIGKDRKRTYYITIKHDFEYIYILMEWENPFKQSGNIEVLFEQDADKQDFYLNNGRVDMYIQGYYRDENLSSSDTREAQIDGSSDLYHVGSRYANDEHQDGSLKGVYMNGKWTLEWKIPMNSGDKDDIYIDRYPTEVGFAVTNPVNVLEGVFPSDATNHDPRTWGTMTIVEERRDDRGARD